MSRIMAPPCLDDGHPRGKGGSSFQSPSGALPRTPGPPRSKARLPQCGKDVKATLTQCGKAALATNRRATIKPVLHEDGRQGPTVAPSCARRTGGGTEF